MAKMVSPNGEVWDIDPSELAMAKSKDFVAFGSPQHMARIGVAAPGMGVRAPSDVVQDDGMGRALARGVIKGGVSSGAGMLQLLGADPNSSGMRDMVDFGTARDTPETVGKTAEQVGEFVLPALAGSRAAKAVTVGQRVMQSRNAAGQFLKAVKKPLVADLVKRAAARMVTESATGGLVNKAQGGDFTTGAATTAGAAGVGAGMSALAPRAATAVQAAYKNPLFRSAIRGTPLLGAAGLFSGKLDSGDLAKAAMYAAFLSPTGLRMAGKASPALTRATSASALQFNRKRARPVNAANDYMGGDGHENLGE